MLTRVSCFSVLIFLLCQTPSVAQDHGGGGCGDVYGDLIHIVRDDVTGQPILARRYVELPKEIPGYGWGYCKIALTEDLREIPFLPFSCDLNLDVDGNGVADYAPVPVDYFGRLSAGRTKEKNQRMHLDEVISTIKMAGAVKAEPATGRLMLGFDCESIDETLIFRSGFEVGDFSEWHKTVQRALLYQAPECTEWRVVDSPMESMALYTRLMKYGHLQTDPEELDIWSHSDPKLVPPFHPALEPRDWLKFDISLRHLLPGDGHIGSCFTDDYPPGGNGVYDPPEAFEDLNGNGQYEVGERFDDANENGVRDPGDTFNPVCADPPEALHPEDFIRAGSFLGGAANKFGRITRDLTQYTNRILKITLDTETTASTADVLPALVRDCEDPDVVYEPPAETDPNPSDPTYLALEDCATYGAHEGLDNYVYFPDVQEKFVDFDALDQSPYRRIEWRGQRIDQLILPDPWEGDTPSAWYLTEDVDIMDWLEIANGPAPAMGVGNIDGFVASASDALRTIEFVHNYAVPAYLPYKLP